MVIEARLFGAMGEGTSLQLGLVAKIRAQK
jgi:hypothetical protein